MPTYIHVNQHRIRANHKHGTKEPVIAVKRGKTNTYCSEVEILGPAKVIYSERPKLSCGARVIIMTEAECKIVR